METLTQTLAAASPNPLLSHDGYVRLRLAQLDMLPFIHLYSETDAHYGGELRAQGMQVQAAGFSEWASDSEPGVSVGWAWYIDGRSRRMLLGPEAVRSNVMLVDRTGYDLGATATAALFAAWLGGFDWQPAVAAAVPEAFSAC